MVKVIVGGKGSGKTARLVDDLNAQAYSDAANVVCIQYGHRLDRMVKYKIRLVDILDYPVHGFSELLSFIAGISAKDYDLTHVYVDTVTKVAQNNNLKDFEDFLGELEVFADKNQLNVTLVLSADPAALPEGITKYC